MSYLKSKQGIGPVVAVSLLIIVTTISVLGFQSWYESYQTGKFAELENQDDFNKVVIENIVGDELYIYNGEDYNISVNQIKLNNKDCNKTINLTSNVVSNVDISTCLINLTSQTQLVALFTQSNIIEKYLYLKDIDPVSIVNTGAGFSSGILTGYAWGENVGFISFDGTNYNVSNVNNNLVGYA